MASPIQTQGFQVGERLNPQYLHPSALVPQYGAIMPAVSQGLDTAGRFAQIYENAQAAPMRRQLAQIQLEEAQARAAMRPMEMQLAELRLAEAQQQAAIPQQIVEQVDLVGGEPLSRSSRDIGAGLGNLEIVEGFTPRERITRGREVAAGGVVSPFERRETMASAAQVRAELEKQAQAAESAKAIIEQRRRGRGYEYEDAVRKYQEAVDMGDTEAAGFYEARINALNTRRPELTETDIYNRKIAGDAAVAGITLAAAKRLAATPEGASALARAVAAQKSSVSSAIVPIRLSAADRAILDAAEIEQAAPVVAQRAAPTTFATEAEAEEAARTGLLKPGTKIIIGGVSGTWK